MKLFLVYPLAALFEIAGCFAFWAWWRLEKSPLWLLPGMVSLALFAWLLTLVPTDAAGRAFAAYGGVYVSVAILWLWGVDGIRPHLWDFVGVAITLLGMGINMFFDSKLTKKKRGFTV